MQRSNLLALLLTGLVCWMLFITQCGRQESAPSASPQAAPQATAPPEAGLAPVAAAPDARTRCLDLAAKADWGSALEPCQEAFAAHRDDMAVEHALMQAQAAAKDEAARP